MSYKYTFPSNDYNTKHNFRRGYLKKLDSGDYIFMVLQKNGEPYANA